MNPRSKAYLDSLKMWGFNLQATMVLEESAELSEQMAIANIIVAKRIRSGIKTVPVVSIKHRKIIEEMADYLIMLEQMCLGLDLKKIFNDVFDEKFERLAKRVNQGNLEAYAKHANSEKACRVLVVRSVIAMQFEQPTKLMEDYCITCITPCTWYFHNLGEHEE